MKLNGEVRKRSSTRDDSQINTAKELPIRLWQKHPKHVKNVLRRQFDNKPLTRD